MKCNRKPTDPKMCPTCNKIYCFSCLQNMASRNEPCACCLKDHQLEQYINCHPILNYFEKLLTNIPEFNLASINICEEHEMPIKYFCSHCGEPICSDCGMISNKVNILI